LIFRGFILARKNKGDPRTGTAIRLIPGALAHDS
jgi:hypothetical protein